MNDDVCAMTGEALGENPVTLPIKDLRLGTETTTLSAESAAEVARVIYKQRGIAETRKRVAARKAAGLPAHGDGLATLDNLSESELVAVSSGRCPKCGAQIRGYRRGGADDSELAQTQRAHGIDPRTGHKITCPVPGFKIAAVSAKSPVHTLR